jgi:hypothetical protein
VGVWLSPVLVVLRSHRLLTPHRRRSTIRRQSGGGPCTFRRHADRLISSRHCQRGNLCPQGFHPRRTGPACAYAIRHRCGGRGRWPRAASTVCPGPRGIWGGDLAESADAGRWDTFPLGPDGRPCEGCLPEPFSRTHERSVRSPASSTATNNPTNGTAIAPTTGPPPATITDAAVNAMLTPAPAAVPR